MFPEFNAQTHFARPAHPGTVTFVGPDGVARVEKAEYIPDWLKFAPAADGTPIPVVKVVRLAGDRSASIRSFGADGRLLWVGLTVPPAPLAHTRESATTPRIATHESARVHAEPTGWF